MAHINVGSDYDVDKNRPTRTPSQSITPDAYYEHGYDMSNVRAFWEKKFIRICIFIVEVRFRDEDLPPYVWHLERCFLSKSQAIEFAGMIKNETNDVRILRQVNCGAPQLAYTMTDDWKVIKNKQEKGGH